MDRRSHGDIIPDLSDPRTQRVYLGELALALGAPPEAVAQGVRMSPTDKSGRRGGWHLDAGVGDLRWSRWLNIETRDPLLALALAWPADKRVSA